MYNNIDNNLLNDPDKVWHHSCYGKLTKSAVVSHPMEIQKGARLCYIFFKFLDYIQFSDENTMKKKPFHIFDVTKVKASWRNLYHAFGLS